MPRILIEIAPEHWQRLKTIAGYQYRDVRRQAQLIVDEALRAALEGEEALGDRDDDGKKKIDKGNDLRLR